MPLTSESTVRRDRAEVKSLNRMNSVPTQTRTSSFWFPHCLERKLYPDFKSSISPSRFEVIKEGRSLL